MIKLKRLKQSFGFALRGLQTVFRFEQSFRLQCVAGIVVIFLALFLRISRNEFIVIMLLVAAVLTLEVINSIFERLVDAFKPRIHPLVKEVKDMMAAAVLITSLFALVIGVLIFYPYVRQLIVFYALNAI